MNDNNTCEWLDKILKERDRYEKALHEVLRKDRDSLDKRKWRYKDDSFAKIASDALYYREPRADEPEQVEQERIDAEGLINETAAAKLAGLSCTRMRQRRLKGTGPKVKGRGKGNSVLYDPKDVHDWDFNRRDNG